VKVWKPPLLLMLQLRETVHLALGALAGVLGAAGFAWLWSRFGHRVKTPSAMRIPVMICGRHDGKMTRRKSSPRERPKFCAARK